MKIELTEQNLCISKAEENVHHCICSDLALLMANVERQAKEQ